MKGTDYLRGVDVSVKILLDWV